MRVVSLLPSATEIVCALGERAALVGRSEECDYPDSVRDLPVVMQARWPGRDGSSAQIDRQVRAVRGRGESLYRLDLGELRRLRPDVVLTQDLCGVCSVTETEVESACREAGLAPQIVSLTPRTLREVWETFHRIAEALGIAGPLPEPLATEPTGAGPAPAHPPTVAVVEWLDPPILAGLWTPDVVRAAGARPLGPTAGAPGQRVTYDELATLDPELVILSPCSFDLRRTRTELRSAPVTQGLSALHPPLGVWLADEAYFSRPGPRLAQGVRLVAALARSATPSTDLPFGRLSPPVGGAVA